MIISIFFFFQAEDGIRDFHVTGVQTCALPICQGRVEIAAELRGDRLVYRVSDTGIGIAADKIDTLFAEFRQGDATISHEFGGTGLGLSITKKFVELHGGRIWIESELGRGSTFFIEIPLRLDGGTKA